MIKLSINITQEKYNEQSFANRPTTSRKRLSSKKIVRCQPPYLKWTKKDPLINIQKGQQKLPNIEFKICETANLKTQLDNTIHISDSLEKAKLINGSSETQLDHKINEYDQELPQYILQINPRYREEEPQNIYSNSYSL